MSSDPIKKEGSMAEPSVALDFAKVEEGQNFADIDRVSERSYGKHHVSTNGYIEEELSNSFLKSEN
jgi:hypothetical protein